MRHSSRKSGYVVLNITHYPSPGLYPYIPGISRVDTKLALPLWSFVVLVWSTKEYLPQVGFTVAVLGTGFSRRTRSKVLMKQAR